MIFVSISKWKDHVSFERKSLRVHIHLWCGHIFYAPLKICCCSYFCFCHEHWCRNLKLRCLRMTDMKDFRSSFEWKRIHLILLGVRDNVYVLIQASGEDYDVHSNKNLCITYKITIYGFAGFICACVIYSKGGNDTVVLGMLWIHQGWPADWTCI